MSAAVGHGPARLRYGVVLFIAILAGFGIIAGEAAAQGALCGTATPTVVDAGQLDDAISCYNTQTPVGDHTITFGADFSHPGGTPTITQTNTDFQLVIEGADHMLTGPGASALPSGLINLFTIAGAAPVTINQLELTAADADAIAANVGAGVVSITNTNMHGNAFGLRVRGGTVTMSNSTVNRNGMDSFGFANAVSVVGGSLAISQSSMVENGGSAISLSGGLLVVSNTTLATNFVGVTVSSGTLMLANSTIYDNTGSGIATIGGSTTVVSSLVADNRSIDCGGTVINGGNNYSTDGSCVGFAMLAPLSSVLTANDNGCAAPTPQGCVETAMLLPGTSASDAGTCVGVVTGIDPATATPVVGDLTTDQRGPGFPRTIGAGCDVGAFESALCQSATPAVTSAVELDHAIACYNEQQPAGDHTITFAADITQTRGSLEIAQANPDHELTIEGANYQLAIPLVSLPSNALFTVNSSAPVTFNEIDLVADIVSGIYVRSSAGVVTISNVDVRQRDYSPDPVPSGVGILVHGGTVSITDSTLHNNAVGLEVAGGSVLVTDSAIADNSASGVGVDSGSVTIMSTTISDNGFANVGIRDGEVAISDSTISYSAPTGDGVYFGGGTATMANSSVDGGLIGIFVDGAASVSIAGSTVTGTLFGGLEVGDDGLVSLSNSTIVDAGVAVLAGVSSGGVWVSNSTLAHNDVGIQVDSGASLSIAASVLGGNTADCQGTLTDGGNNFATGGSCGSGFASLSPGSLAADSVDNGCAVPTTAGCVETVALLPVSNAIGGGDCTGMVTGLDPLGDPILGDLVTDQRGDGFARTKGANCDAGAFEVDLQAVFVDVPPDSAFYTDAVTWAAANEITSGTTTTAFTPNGLVTRAQMATFLWRFAGEPAPQAANPFTDVPPAVFFTDAVTWLAETGVTSGTSATTFSPDDSLTRAQIATFLWRFAGEPAPTMPHPFTDVPANEFYTTAVTWLAEAGITSGTSATTFSPSVPLTRGQAVTFLHRFAQQPPF